MVSAAANPTISAKLQDRDIVVTGNGWATNGMVQLTYSLQDQGELTSKVTTDGAGAFSTKQSVPLSLSGMVHITAKGKRPRDTATAVPSTPSSASGSATPPSNLPAAATPTASAATDFCQASGAVEYGKWAEHWSEPDANAAQPVRLTDGTWHFVAPATSNTTPKRRSEVFWSANGTPLRPKEGDTLCYDVEFTGQLGAAAQSDQDWHVLMQVVGTVDGKWLGPSFGLHVRNGEIRLGGGGGHPLQNYSSSNHEWNHVLSKYEDGRTYRLTVQAKLSSDTNIGWLNAWVDGTQVVSQYQPISPQGLKPGTLYPGNDGIAVRSGLYRGTDASGTRPTYEQWTKVKPLSISLA